ncbi:MAG TPA: hypothetical protein VM345_14390 [Acidimicrobiales bacterium]|nr:hypothetical protein [Acidimicrobiales bacterium]
MPRPVARALSLVLVATLVGGCGLGSKDAQAKRIRASLTAAEAASPVTGSVTFELELDREAAAELAPDQRAQLETALAASAAAGNPTLKAATGIDSSTKRAVVTFEGTEEPAAVFVDTQLFTKRRNARATERRTWARLDIMDPLTEERPIDLREMTPPQTLTAAATTLSPVHIVELIEGTLTGSVKAKGNEAIGEVQVARFDMNISLDKAMKELDFDDEQREARLRLIRLLGSRNDVLPARAWIDDQGRLRRFEVELDQRVTRRRTNHLKVRLDLDTFGAPVAIEPPSNEVTVTYERFGRLVRSVLPEES